MSQQRARLDSIRKTITVVTKTCEIEQSVDQHNKAMRIYCQSLVSLYLLTSEDRNQWKELGRSIDGPPTSRNSR